MAAEAEDIAHFGPLRNNEWPDYRLDSALGHLSVRCCATGSVGLQAKMRDTAGMDFNRVLETITREFALAGIEHALIGAFAMAALGVPRATGDIDFLVAGERCDDVDRIMTSLGYRALHRSADAANYTSQSLAGGRVDYLFGRRPHSRAMLARAKPRSSLRTHVTVKVVEAEDLIGLKVQSSTNNPKRALLDMADIQRLLENQPGLDLDRVREYFRIFEREPELDQVLARIKR